MVPLALLGAAGLVLLLSQRGVRLSNWLIARGHARASRFVLHFVDASPVKTLTLLTCDLVEGKTQAGLARVEGLLALVPQVPDQWRLLLINSLSNVLINAGNIARRWRCDE